jgi:hypothetical protein
MDALWSPRASEHVHLARRVPRGSLTGASRNMPSERVRDTFVQRYDLAKHVGPKPRLRILGTTEGVSGRLQHFSLTRMVPARSWSRRSSSGTPAGLCLHSSRCRSQAGGRFGNDSAVPAGRHRGARGLSDAGKAHPAVKARWVGFRLGAATYPAPGTSISLSPKLARANTSATGHGPSQREMCGPQAPESTLRSFMPLARLQARRRGR